MAVKVDLSPPIYVIVLVNDTVMAVKVDLSSLFMSSSCAAI